MMKIVCIIPSACTNKTLPYIKRCIRSLRIAATRHLALTALVVSANPEARTLLVRSPLDNFYLVDPSLGFAQMNNVAIEESMRFYQSDYYLLINDDAYVRKDFFEVLQKNASKIKPDIICPLIYKLDGFIDSYGIEYFTSGFAKNAHTTTINTTLTQAACVLIKTKFVKKMIRLYGFFFNPILHSYYEDTEFSIRALAVGSTIYKITDLVAYHRGSSSWRYNSKPVMYHTFRNMLWVIFIAWPTQYILKNLYAIITVQIWFFICSIRDGAWWIYPKIIIDTFQHIQGLRIYRNQIIKTYTQNFASIFSPYWFRTRRQGKGLRFPFFC